MSDPVASATKRSGAPPPELVASLLSHLPGLDQHVKRVELPYYLDGVEQIEAEPKQVLFSQGARVERVLLLISGEVEEVRAHVIDGQERRLRLRLAAPGTLLGIYDLIYRHPHGSWARATKPSLFVSIPAAQITRLLYRFPALRNSLLPVDRMNRLRTIPLLAKVDAVALSYLAEAMVKRQVKAGTTLYQAGDDATTLYLIDQGQVLLEYEDSRRLWLGTGAEFGIGDRLSAPPGEVYKHDHNARALCATEILSLPRGQFSAITGLSPEREGARQRKLRSTAVQELAAFAQWSPDARAQLLGYMSHYHMPASYLVTQQGEPVDSMWVLLSGQGALLHALDTSGDAMPESHVEGTTWFNESALRERGPATSTIEAEAGSAWLRLHGEDFVEFLNQSGHAALGAKLHAAFQPPSAIEARRRKRFPWLDVGESVVLEIRRHWIELMRKTIPAFVLTLLAVLVALRFLPFEVTQDGSFPFMAWVLIFLLLAAPFAWLWGVLDYYNDYLVVTSRRVVHQEKLIFFKNNRYMAPLESIRDVQVRQNWWGTVLGYATLEVQTPGTLGNILFDRAAHFKHVVDVIRSQRALRAREARITGKKQIHSMLENRLGVTLELPERVRWPAPQALVAETTAQRARWRKRQVAPSSGARTPTRLVWRQHWIILVRNIIGEVLLLAVLLAAAAFFQLTSIEALWRGYLSWTSLIAAFLVLFWTIYVLEDWRLDMYILESDQVIDIERKPFGLDRNQRTALLTDIVDIRFEQPSPLHFIFNFGSVFLQTAATDGQFTFLNLPDPQGVAETIRRRRDQVIDAQERKSANQRAEEFPDWLEIYTRLQPGRLD